MSYVFPNCTAVVAWEGGRVHLNPGQQWRTDDPFVMARPGFFDVDPTHASTTEPPVERATRAPGERRVTARKPASSKKPATPGE